MTHTACYVTRQHIYTSCSVCRIVSLQGTGQGLPVMHGGPRTSSQYTRAINGWPEGVLGFSSCSNIPSRPRSIAQQRMRDFQLFGSSAVVIYDTRTLSYSLRGKYLQPTKTGNESTNKECLKMQVVVAPPLHESNQFLAATDMPEYIHT